MTTFWHHPVGTLQELRAGGSVEVNGRRRRVVALTVSVADADDPEMGVQAGDMVTMIELSEDEMDAEREALLDLDPPVPDVPNDPYPVQPDDPKPEEEPEK